MTMTQRRTVTIVMLLLLSLLSFALAPSALAQQCVNKKPTAECAQTERTFITNAQCACCGDCELSDFIGLAIAVSRFIFGITGSLALIMFAYGGFYWLTSGGAAERLEKGKKAMTAAAMGMIIIFCAWLLVNSLLAALTGNFKQPNKILTGQWWKPPAVNQTAQ